MKNNILLLLMFFSVRLMADAPLNLNLIKNADFEHDTKKWSMECSDAGSDWLATWSNMTGRSTGGGALEMRSGIYARIRAISSPLALNGGDTITVCAWFRGDSETSAKPGSAGVVIRITPVNAKDIADDQSVYLPIKGGPAVGASQVAAIEPVATIPVAWAKIEHTFTLPPDVRGVRVELMTYRTSGKIWWDDVSVILKP
jgi:hypothetical protein